MTSTYPRDRWRLFIGDPADGATNMAVDEAILLAVAEGASPPTLRFFAWAPPCLSLGRSQSRADADLDRLEAHGYHLVRRPTGGKAILHADELTYSVVTPQGDPRVSGDIVESYRRLSEGLMRGLALMDLAGRNDGLAGPQPAADSNPVCFETPSNYEITVGGKKLIGSAQARRQGVVLQHGSLPLRGDIARICDVLQYPDEAARQAARERVRARAITLEAALGRAVPPQAAITAMARGFAEALALDFDAGPLTDAEWARGRELREAKYLATSA